MADSESSSPLSRPAASLPYRFVINHSSTSGKSPSERRQVQKREMVIIGYRAKSTSCPRVTSRTFLNNVLGLGPCASRVSTVGVTRELNLLSRGQLKDLLEAASNRQENVLTLLGATSLSASNITLASTGDALSDGASPDTNTEESLTDVDDNTHDLAIILVLKGLANGAHHNLEPKTVDVDISLVLVLVRPLATMLVLGVLPLGANTLLEKMVIGLER